MDTSRLEKAGLRPKKKPESLHQSRRKSNPTPYHTISESCDQGRFSNSEKQAIKQAVELFLAERNYHKEDLPKLLARHPDVKQDASQFLDYLILKSNVKRNARQIYWHLRRDCKIQSTGKRWLKSEDARLCELQMLYGNKWARIELEMERKAVRERFRALQAKEEKKNAGKWREDEDLRLLNAVCRSFKKDKFDPAVRPTNWLGIANYVGSRTHLQCLARWYKTLRFCVNEKLKLPSWTRKDYVELLNRLTMLKPENEENIDYLAVANSSLHESWNRGFNSHSIKLRWYKLKKKIPNVEKMTILDALKYARKHLDDLLSRNVLQDEDLPVLRGDNVQKLLHNSGRRVFDKMGVLANHATLELSKEFVSSEDELDDTAINSPNVKFEEDDSDSVSLSGSDAIADLKNEPEVDADDLLF